MLSSMLSMDETMIPGLGGGACVDTPAWENHSGRRCADCACTALEPFFGGRSGCVAMAEIVRVMPSLQTRARAGAATACSRRHSNGQAVHSSTTQRSRAVHGSP